MRSTAPRSTAAPRSPRHPTAGGAADSPLAARAAAACAATLLLPASACASPASAAEAHEEAVLEAPVSTVAAGAELALTGRDFAAGEDHRLRLVGVLEEHDLGEVSPDSAGTFERAVRIPRGTSEGRYQIEAVAPDGDVAARLSITVVEGSGAGGTDAVGAGERPSGRSEAGGRGAEGEAGAAGVAPADEATAEELEIDHSRSALGWAIVLLLVGGAGGMGVRLLRRRA